MNIGTLERTHMWQHAMVALSVAAIVLRFMVATMPPAT